MEKNHSSRREIRAVDFCVRVNYYLEKTEMPRKVITGEMKIKRLLLGVMAFLMLPEF